MAASDTTANEDRTRVWDLIKDIRMAMLTTSDARGAARARPMALANGEFDGDLWFFTRDHSLKTQEIARNPRVVVAFSDERKQHYVSVTGAAQIVEDRETLKRMWSEGARVWFPKGVDDPELALICIPMEEAEFWDSPSATAVYLYGYAKAMLTGEPPELGENRKVSF